MITITTRSNGRADVQFPYDRHAVEVVHGLGGRTWHPRKRCWSIGNRLVPVAAQSFSDAGYKVAVDGKMQDAGANPFPALKSAMDATTWRKVSRVLSEVLNPANGGDERLAALLKRTVRAEQEDHRRVAS